MKSDMIKAAGLTDVGLKRKENEDCFSADDVLGLYVVADGMGGHLAGEVASQIAVDLITKSFKKWIGSEVSEEVIFGSPDPSLSKAGNYVLSSIRLANRVIHEMATQSEKYRGMGTTVVVLAVMPGLIISANVGDSRIYLVRNGEIERLSKDHTIVAEQVEMGVLNKEEAENSPLKHVLTRNLGACADIEAEIFELEPTNNERFILCTDGLTDLMSDDEILNMVEEEDSPETLCGNFIDKALERGGHDNTTVISVFLPGREAVRVAPMRRFGGFVVDILTSSQKIIRKFRP